MQIQLKRKLSFDASLSSHTSSQMAVGLSAWTSNMTHIGSKYNYGRSIFCENKNHFAGSFGDSCQHAQPILPIFGRFFCLCTTGPPKLPAKIFLFLQKMNLRTLYFKPIIAKTLVHKLYPTAIWDEVCHVHVWTNIEGKAILALKVKEDFGILIPH